MKRKQLLTLTISFIICMMMSLTSLAANGSIRFSDPSVSVGQEVNVTMKITAEDNAKIKDVNVTLKYPADKLEFVSGTDADGGAGIIRVHGASNGSGSDTVEYNLKFNTSSAGSFNIKTETQEVYDDNGKVITLTHLGESTVVVSAAADASSVCDLNSLEVYPGELLPEFSIDNTNYRVDVGTSVDKLNINAIPADASANIRIDGNEAFELGENNVSITVVAADGVTEKKYILTVDKKEGGPEINAPEGVDTNNIEGVQLSSKGKSITIMNPTGDVVIPEGLRTGTISIDGKKVQGWVVEGDENPEYCVVYGMNDQGEFNFYRYDRTEKTIQRYFASELAENSVTAEEYNELLQLYNDNESKAQISFIGLCAVSAIAFILLIVVIYLSVRIGTINRNQKRQADLRLRSEAALSEEENGPSVENKQILSHEFDQDVEESENSIDETQIISRSERRRRKKASPLDDSDI